MKIIRLENVTGGNSHFTTIYNADKNIINIDKSDNILMLAITLAHWGEQNPYIISFMDADTRDQAFDLIDNYITDEDNQDTELIITNEGPLATIIDEE